MRDGFPHGEHPLKIEPAEFSSRAYTAFLDSIQTETAASRARQQAAFAAERERWAEAGQSAFGSDDADNTPPPDTGVPEGCEAVTSPLASSVWKILVEPGQPVRAGDTLLILEAMKVEWAVTAPNNGVVEEIRTKPDALTLPGQSLVILRTTGGAA